MKKLLKILLIQACFVHIAFADSIKVVTTSKSSQKNLAVIEAFEKKFPNDEIILISYKSSSNVPEEPVGRDTALEGALHRIESLPFNFLAEGDYVVSIENFIEFTDNGWQDLGLVIVKNLQEPSKQIVTFTEATPVPTQYVDLAQEMSDLVTEKGFSVTVGAAIQRSFPLEVIDPQDWHKEKMFGNISRTILLEEALFKALRQEDLLFLKDQIVAYLDFPKPGIIFEDFFPLLRERKAFQMCIDLLYERYKDKNIEVVVGLESRGFILGAALAYKLEVGFCPIRKPGKLPCPTHAITYNKEYGSDTLVISKTDFSRKERVLIVDDLIATGGSAKAAIELVKLAGGIPVEFVSLLEIKALKGRSVLGIPSFNLID
jgi:adenine phosphoribosyltransferase